MLLLISLISLQVAIQLEYIEQIERIDLYFFIQNRWNNSDFAVVFIYL